MKCPHCLVAMHPDIKVFSLGNDVDEKQRLWTARRVDCPACNEPIITVVSKRGNYDTKAYPAYPRIQSRNPLPPEVKEEYAKDYQEASQILQDSPRASAAISRRCLQQLLREVAQVKHSDLAKEIQDARFPRLSPADFAD